MRYIKIDGEGHKTEEAGKKYIVIGSKVVVNPKDEHYREAGFLPVLNDGDAAEQREGYIVTGEKFTYDAVRDGYVKAFEYTEAPVVEEPAEEVIEPEGEEA